MSNCFATDSDFPLIGEELVQLGTAFREHRKDKYVLESSHSESSQVPTQEVAPEGFESETMRGAHSKILEVEQHEKSLSMAHMEDKKYIQRLEKELLNCSQEIDYLQDQLSARNTEVTYLEERVCDLEMEFKEKEDLRKEVSSLKEKLKICISQQLSLVQELETKEVELEQSALTMEESFSSMGLESQFEVESMKLDMMTLEQSLFEGRKVQEETLEENNRMGRLIDKLQDALQDAQKTIISLNEENKVIKEKLDTANMNTRLFSQKVKDWLENKDRPQIKDQSSLSEQRSKGEDTRIYGEILGPLLGILAMKLDPASELKGKMEMSCQIQEYEFLVEKLKEELREEKLRAKEEAEDLVQEMAELRYQLTGQLEEECKRRACIEHVSLQRIAELEAQV
ncbi:myosin heavy chain-like protein [Trifolium pratense]|uniref:Myosin heavy chain-like protein n=1 Tax=Trifolium pratense TaxID=57577 RepID=A0A2K3PHF1_TRIPR|nr:myosin heavy chain-like protein [Trifolium pratense]